MQDCGILVGLGGNRASRGTKYQTPEPQPLTHVRLISSSRYQEQSACSHVAWTEISHIAKKALVAPKDLPPLSSEDR